MGVEDANPEDVEPLRFLNNSRWFDDGALRGFGDNKERTDRVGAVISDEREVIDAEGREIGEMSRLY